MTCFGKVGLNLNIPLNIPLTFVSLPHATSLFLGEKAERAHLATANGSIALLVTVKHV